MKIVILAAGAGARLGKDPLPKPLTALANGTSILEQQIQNIASCFSLDQVIIVVGYHKESITQRYPHLKFVENPNFEFENTSKSLLKAIEGLDEDVLWMNGDVIFKSSVLRKVRNFAYSCMVVNKGAVKDEEVKYRTDGALRILEVSKEVEKPEGEALGINYFDESDVAILKKKLILCEPMDYFEKAIEMCIEEGMDVSTVVVEEEDAMEIDFPEDLERANEIMSRWKFI